MCLINSEQEAERQKGNVTGSREKAVVNSQWSIVRRKSQILNY